MGLLSFFQNSQGERELEGENLVLRPPSMADFRSWRDQRLASRNFLVPWEPEWKDDEHLLSSFRLRLRRYQDLIDSDQAYPFFIFAGGGKDVLGGITLSNVKRGISQSATLGYWIGEAHANSGHMTRALARLLPFCFHDLALHRLEAACLPRNLPSIHLLQRAGFAREGYAKGYLKIAGHWEDHVLWAKLAPENPVMN